MKVCYREDGITLYIRHQSHRESATATHITEYESSIIFIPDTVIANTPFILQGRVVHYGNYLHGLVTISYLSSVRQPRWIVQHIYPNEEN